MNIFSSRSLIVIIGTGILTFLLGLLLAVALIRSRRQLAARDALPLIMFGLLGFYTVRTVSWFGMVATPLLAATLAGRPGKGRSRPGHARLNAVLMAGFALLALLSLPWLRPHLPLPETNRGFLLPDTPVQAAEVLCQEAGEEPIRLFADMAYASYVEWACPAAGVFVDTRIEQYPKEQWLDYLALSNGRYDWEKWLERYGLTALLWRLQTPGPPHAGR